MAWDVTTPPDTESQRNGATRIRELKSDLASIFASQGIFDGTNLSYKWKPSYGATGSRPGTPATGELYVNTTLGVIERYSGSAWVAISTLIPPTTVMVFYQAAAPSGWTQVTTSNDAALRVVSGAGGGTGGTDSIATPPTHTHTVTNSPIFANQSSPSNVGNSVSSPTGASTAFSPKYVDVIVASKN